ncbi:MAG: hypothetical protein NBKEAIPA_02414 [Nitrospirae bacterium]|nr:MAG: putative flagellar chaperone FlgN [Nitrospira sp. OLB3]MBV6470499.1 hypothetical protein [Nitrospirota bacterium]MCK6494040.1 flagellar protein FlgN [Nitrospira sp.]MCK6497948.1 flagellar protein FlgN [Nitrospira sp.]MEB2338594.1 flagellar export chaperone FlgN [Nitrospirales bacterium]
MSTTESSRRLETQSLLSRLYDKVIAFQTLLRREQQAIRTLSFSEFTQVTMKKAQLLEELRELEGVRRVQQSEQDGKGSSVVTEALLAKLLAAVEETDRLNRLNAGLVEQSLEFLQGALRAWQRSSGSAELYSSSGVAVPAMGGRIGMRG